MEATGQDATRDGVLPASILGLPSELAERMGIEYVEAAPGRVVGRMPVSGNRQPYGLLHGGASCVLAETLGSVTAMLDAGPERIVMGIEINATHHRAVRDGFVTGTCITVHRGRSIATYAVDMVDDGGERVCTARLTCVIRQRPPESPGAGGGSPAG